MRKLLALTLVLAMCVLPVVAADITTANTSGSSSVLLDVEEPVFSITVPTALPVHMDADGVVTTSTDLKILNNSHGMVKVTALEINPTSGWTIVDYDTDMRTQIMNSNKIGFTLNGDTTADDGTISYTDANWPAIAAATTEGVAGELAISYSAVVSGSTKAINAATVATVVFTVNWATA